MLIRFKKDHRGKKKGAKIEIASNFANELINKGIAEAVIVDEPEIKKIVTDAKTKKSNYKG